MADVLIYSKDFVRPADGMGKPRCWHSSAPVFGDVRVGDRVWVITSGKSIGHKPDHAGFLVAVWQVQAVVNNPGDDPAYPTRKFHRRVIASDVDSIEFTEPVCVDDLIRPRDGDQRVSIGRFLRMPRRLDDEMLRQFRAAAGPELALKWLTGSKT